MKIYIFVGFAPHYPSDEDVHKIKGFVPRRGDQREMSRRQLLDFTTLWVLTLRQTTQSGEAEKAILHIVWT